MSATRGRAAAAVLVMGALAAGGCLESAGGSCRLDSDCRAGLVCAFDGVCRTFAAVSASFDVVQDVDVVTFDTAKPDSVADTNGSGCAAIAGVFAAGSAPCPVAPDVRQVTGLVIQDHDNGLAQLAGVANQVLANGFGNGDITLSLHIDGTFQAGCSYALAWVRTAADIHADCTPEFGDSMPLDIPGLVSTSVDYATLNPDTHVLTGLVDKQKLLLALDPALRDVADQLIVEDVDTDGDHVPDKASAIIAVQFGGD